MFRTIWLSLALLCLGVSAPGQDEFAKRASWDVPTAEAVKVQLFEWIATHKLDELRALEVEALWPEGSLPQPGRDVLQHVAVTIGAVDPDAKPIVDLCRGGMPRLLPPPPQMLASTEKAPFEVHNLRLYYACWLAQSSFYDEAAHYLEGLQPEQVVDPGSLLFYQSVVAHRLLKKDECLASLEKLLENEAVLPRRYLSVAKLMQTDIAPLKVDSLDEVSRLMDDIRRRLAFGRAGTRVRDQEEDVIAKLDKMIDELEKKRKQQQQSGSGNANNLAAQQAGRGLSACWRNRPWRY